MIYHAQSHVKTCMCLHRILLQPVPPGAAPDHPIVDHTNGLNELARMVACLGLGRVGMDLLSAIPAAEFTAHLQNGVSR